MEIIEKAPAKINLGLDILHKRDDNYHEVKMIMASVDLADKVSLTELPTSEIKVETDCSFLPLDEKNHVYQAARLVKETYNIEMGVHIRIDKRIPVAAGMAGGSSDAAATLRGLNKLWDLQLSQETLAELGAKIGSDVPYCVAGGTKLATGRGEILCDLSDVPPCWVVIVKPPISVSTWTIFTELDIAKLGHPDIKLLRSSIENNDYQEMIKHMGNSLEKATSEKYPIVAQIKNRMLDYGADAAVMSGSGPTVVALCDKHSRAQRVYNGVKGFCDEVYLVRTLKS
ncbi:4-(cytidine 5'-diphospho)-2-C-methyl-D-erythritol kinase [Vagococcus coleopterorum]|uniref:4-diphosphocytidyl-2-C-methyl-D-erythritol kinase n=1 Tax=Vagococcus coleopterorum TaxID=2714946 RepID=A0A6G8APH1_9ENTE|nr:4-(cytidine 5'-diphospho)-2-C-methyl-D-erythritol kinase [Vagococcus coleopterorum]QIL46978.1 4-(cytidine 5'-diphospho)-2-C-methyl-D-erythritol kinase [Vagococcus coleopterorum]